MDVVVLILVFVFVILLLGFLDKACLFSRELFAVRNWDLEVVGMDLTESEESMAIAAVLDKGSLERRF